jgi:hypothetical protein
MPHPAKGKNCLITLVIPAQPVSMSSDSPAGVTTKVDSRLHVDEIDVEFARRGGRSEPMVRIEVTTILFISSSIHLVETNLSLIVPSHELIGGNMGHRRNSRARTRNLQVRSSKYFAERRRLNELNRKRAALLCGTQGHDHGKGGSISQARLKQAWLVSEVEPTTSMRRQDHAARCVKRKWWYSGAS